MEKDRFSLMVLHNLKYAEDRKKLANYLYSNNFRLLNGTNFQVNNVLKVHKEKYLSIVSELKNIDFKQERHTIIINCIEFDFFSLKNII